MVTKKSCSFLTFGLTCPENEEIEPAQRVQMNNYQSSTYGQELSWLHLDKSKGFKRGQQSYTPVSVAYLAHPSSSSKDQTIHDNIIPCEVVWQICHLTERRSNLEVATNRVIHKLVKIQGWFQGHITYGCVSLPLLLVVQVFLKS